MVKEFSATDQNKIVSVKNVSSYIKNLVCNINRKGCMLREYLDCKNRNLFKEFIVEITNFYYSWVRSGAKKRHYTVKITSRKTIECTYEKLVTACKEMLSIYLKHCFTTSHQFQAMHSFEANLKQHETLLVLDISQNYLCKYGSEIQSVET